MNLNDYNNLHHATQALGARGFSEEFVFTGQALLHTDTEQTYQADDLALVEYHRFIDGTDTDNSTMIFALETKDETKGTVELSYAMDDELKLIKFIDKIKIKASPSSN